MPSSYDPEILRNEAEEVGDYAENADGAFTGAVLRSLIDQEIFYQDEWYETDEPEREPSLSDWISAAGTDDSGNPNESIGAETLAAMRAIEDRGGTTDFVVSPTRTESRTYIRSTYSE
ncbi:MAG TPA: hypothetical protein PK765_01335 [bacterium]|nr:hypothetical protein [bacterium]